MVTQTLKTPALLAADVSALHGPALRRAVASVLRWEGEPPPFETDGPALWFLLEWLDRRSEVQWRLHKGRKKYGDAYKAEIYAHSVAPVYQQGGSPGLVVGRAIVQFAVNKGWAVDGVTEGQP